MEGTDIDELFTSLKTDVFIEVHVPSSQKPLLIPKTVLSMASPIFEKALGDDKYKEGHGNVFHFKDDNAEAVDLFVYWMYYGVLPVANSEKQDDEKEIHLDTLLHSWILGDKYRTRRFQKSVMEELCKHAVLYKAPGTSWISKVWTSTISHSVLREFFIEWAAVSIMQDELYAEEFAELYTDCKGFAQGVISTLQEMWGSKRSRKQYFQYTEGFMVCDSPAFVSEKE